MSVAKNELTAVLYAACCSQCRRVCGADDTLSRPVFDHGRQIHVSPFQKKRCVEKIRSSRGGIRDCAAGLPDGRVGNH